MISLTHEGGVVYLLTSPSGKQYVGQTWEFEKRMHAYEHKASASQRVLYNAIVKYGWENFTVTIIKRDIQTQDAMDATEDAFILMLDTLAPNGYNLRRGGSRGKHHADSIEKMRASSIGQKCSLETRKKMSEAHSGEKNAMFGKRGEDHPVFGRHHTSEACAKIRESQLGEGNSMYGRRGADCPAFGKRGENHPAFGRHHTSEEIDKMKAGRFRFLYMQHNTVDLFGNPFGNDV